MNTAEELKEAFTDDYAGKMGKYLIVGRVENVIPHLCVKFTKLESN